MMNRFRERFAGFMAGRYGQDHLGQLFVGLGLILVLAGVFTRSLWVDFLAFLCLVACYARMFSKNIRKRYEENQKYERLRQRVIGLWKNRRFHIYKCPECGQKIRIPRGKGKISIHCPKCGHDFIKRS